MKGKPIKSEVWVQTSAAHDSYPHVTTWTIVVFLLFLNKSELSGFSDHEKPKSQSTYSSSSSQLFI